jgi:hypothetical protein
MTKKITAKFTKGYAKSAKVLGKVQRFPIVTFKNPFNRWLKKNVDDTDLQK